MPDSLSIRSYSLQREGHTHSFHQLVLPLRGNIFLESPSYKGPLGPGEAVLIRAGQHHNFKAPETARFIVADMNELPATLAAFSHAAFRISDPLRHYLNFVETQLQYQLNNPIEQAMFTTFNLLLKQERQVPQLDRRIQNAIQHAQARLGDTLQVGELARVACLSETHFKKIFREQTGTTVMRYLTRERMEKAAALLQHTDYSIGHIAASVGFNNASAFSRCFKQYFSASPSDFISKKQR